MNPGQVSKFLIDYRKKLETMIMKRENRAQYFEHAAGDADVASERILKFIRENSTPSKDFLSTGIKLKNKNGYASDGDSLYRLSRELLKALDTEFYNRFILNTGWQSGFKFQRKEKGEIIIRKGVEADGVYFLTKGTVHVLDEMAYFSMERTTNATVTAMTDLELYFISGEDFMKYPEIEDLFKRIAKNRMQKPENEKLIWGKTNSQKAWDIDETLSPEI